MGFSEVRVAHHGLTFQLELEHTRIGSDPQAERTPVRIGCGLG